MSGRQFWRSLVGVATVGVLVGTLAQPVAAEEAPEPGPFLTDEQLLELPPEPDGEGGGEVLPEPSVPESGGEVQVPIEQLRQEAAEAFEAAQEQLSGAGDAEEVEAPVRESELPPDSAIVKQDEYSNTYDLGEGVRLTDVSVEPMNVRADGEWKEIQTDVTGVGFWSSSAWAPVRSSIIRCSRSSRRTQPMRPCFGSRSPATKSHTR